MPGHGGNRTYDLWNTSPMLCQLSPVWIYTQSNITNISYSPEYTTPTQKKEGKFVLNIDFIMALKPDGLCVYETTKQDSIEFQCIINIDSLFYPRGTNSPRLFTPGETKALAKSKVHQISRAWVTVRGWSSSLISKIWRTVMNSEHCDWSNCDCMTTCITTA